MTLKFISLLVLLMFTHLIYSQEKFEKGSYITSDKLKYIRIIDDSKFEYIAYKGKSPYTIKEKQKNKKSICGTIGYIVEIDGQGIGTYTIVNQNIVLDFEIDFSTIATRPIDTKLLKGLTFQISKLEKLNY